MIILPKNKQEVGRILSDMSRSSKSKEDDAEFIINRLTYMISKLKDSYENKSIEFGDKFYKKLNRLNLKFKLKRYNLITLVFDQKYRIISGTMDSLIIQNCDNQTIFFIDYKDNRIFLSGMRFKTDSIKANFIQLLLDIKKG